MKTVKMPGIAKSDPIVNEIGRSLRGLCGSNCTCAESLAATCSHMKGINCAKTEAVSKRLISCANQEYRYTMTISGQAE